MFLPRRVRPKPKIQYQRKVVFLASWENVKRMVWRFSLHKPFTEVIQILYFIKSSLFVNPRKLMWMDMLVGISKCSTRKVKGSATQDHKDNGSVRRRIRSTRRSSSTVLVFFFLNRLFYFSACFDFFHIWNMKLINFQNASAATIMDITMRGRQYLVFFFFFLYLVPYQLWSASVIAGWIPTN